MPDDESAGGSEDPAADADEKQAFDDADITGSSASFPTGPDDDDENEADDSSGSDDDDHHVPAREPLPAYMLDKNRPHGSSLPNGGTHAPHGHPKSIVHSVSLAHLSSTVPQQSRQVTSQGWTVFDDAPPLSSSPGTFPFPTSFFGLV